MFWLASPLVALGKDAVYRHRAAGLGFREYLDLLVAGLHQIAPVGPQCRGDRGDAATSPLRSGGSRRNRQLGR